MNVNEARRIQKDGSTEKQVNAFLELDTVLEEKLFKKIRELAADDVGFCDYQLDPADSTYVIQQRYIIKYLRSLGYIVTEVLNTETQVLEKVRVAW